MVIIGSLHQQLGVRPIEEVLVCDSIYNTLDSATLDVIANLFHSSTVKMLKSKKQEKTVDYSPLLMPLQLDMEYICLV